MLFLFLHSSFVSTSHSFWVPSNIESNPQPLKLELTLSTFFRSPSYHACMLPFFALAIAKVSLFTLNLSCGKGRSRKHASIPSPISRKLEVLGTGSISFLSLHLVLPLTTSQIDRARSSGCLRQTSLYRLVVIHAIRAKFSSLSIRATERSNSEWSSALWSDQYAVEQQ